MRETAIDKVKKVFKEISKKPIFICSSQTIEMNGHIYKDVPHCDYVQISFEDYNKLNEAINKLRDAS
jgi:hypothetical protein